MAFFVVIARQTLNEKYLILLVFLTLLSCCRTKTEEIDLSSYFAGLNGTAVFYNANTGQSKIYNKALSYKQSSPCSTFKSCPRTSAFPNTKYQCRTLCANGTARLTGIPNGTRTSPFRRPFRHPAFGITAVLLTKSAKSAPNITCKIQLRQYGYFRLERFA